MKIFDQWYDRPPKRVGGDTPPKKGMARFFGLFLRNFFSLMQLNLQFLLFCIPLLTIPAACTAMSRLTLDMVRDRPYALWRDFCTTFKAEFIKSTPVGLALFAGSFAALSGGLLFARAAEADPLAYLPAGLCVLLLLVLTLMSYYLFPMLALLELPLGQILKNALLMALAGIGNGLAALAVTAALLLVLLGTFPYTVPLFFVLFFSVTNFITTFAAYPAIQKHAIAE